MNCQFSEMHIFAISNPCRRLDGIFLTFKSVLDVPINDVDRSGAVDHDGQEGEGD